MCHHRPALCMRELQPFENSIQLTFSVNLLGGMNRKSDIHKCGGAHVDVIELV